MKCRHCHSKLDYELIDLGAQPPSNSYLHAQDLDKEEIYLPLRVYVCSKCFLVQTADFTQRETFFNKEYAYFSSTSKTWLEHATLYVRDIVEQFSINKNSFVIEVASNDGYLLRNFVDRGIPCLGIEPTKSTAAQSKAQGINTLVDFYGVELARQVKKEYGQADLITCNNVYAHVPDINDFTEALEISLAKEGVVTIEFPHLLNLINSCQFDTIYHEHFSYLSVATVNRILGSKKLRVFDVEEISTHGGSVRVYGCRESAQHVTKSSVGEIIRREEDSGLFDLKTFEVFQHRAISIKLELLDFLIKARADGKLVCGYGAAAKGNTLLNFAGIKSDLLQFVADAAPSKIDKFLPGSRIPILPPKAVSELNPDFVVILPWNIASEVKSQFYELAKNGTKFVTFIPNYMEI